MVFLIFIFNFFKKRAGAHKEFSQEEIEEILKKMEPLTEYPAGIPTSLIHTGEQWDYPNSWAPTGKNISFYFFILIICEKRNDDN